MTTESYHDYNTMDNLISDIFDKVVCYCGHNLDNCICEEFIEKKILEDNAVKQIKKYLNENFEKSEFDFIGTYTAVFNLINLADYVDVIKNQDKLEDELVRIRDDIAPCGCYDCRENNPTSKLVYGEIKN